MEKPPEEPPVQREPSRKPAPQDKPSAPKKEIKFEKRDAKPENGIVYLDNPQLFYGRRIDNNTKNMIEVTDGDTEICCWGEVFGTEVRTINTKRGETNILTFSFSDYTNSLTASMFVDPKRMGEVAPIKDGAFILVNGTYEFDNYKNEFRVKPKAMALLQKYTEKDEHEGEKRVELHCHTNMSAKDAVSGADLIVKQAYEWGHKAVAITDHGVVQSYPAAAAAVKGIRKGGGEFKVIYGVEAYFVDDTARALYGSANAPFDGEYIVFDTETTGLSVYTCALTEIGAVLVRGGEVVDEFCTYVDPGMPIPEKITELTGINDEMVKGAPSAREAVKSFLEFCGDRILIAHNAGFDIGFIRAVCSENKIPFNNTYLDTVALSRYLNPELKKHKLDVLADYYKLGEFNHHRASDDAKMLAEIFFCMVNKLNEEGINDFTSMANAMSSSGDPLKLRPNHMIILVKNKVGLKNLYKLVSKSYLEYLHKTPRIPKTVLNEYREGLIIGSACVYGELYSAILDNRPYSDLMKIAGYYDYLEIQPDCNNMFFGAGRPCRQR